MDILEAVRIIQEAPHEIQEIQNLEVCERIVEAMREMYWIAISCYVSAPVGSPILDDPIFSVDGIKALQRSVPPLVEEICQVRQLRKAFEGAPKRNIHGEGGVASQLGLSMNAVKSRIKALGLEYNNFRCGQDWLHILHSSERVRRKYAEAIQWARTAIQSNIPVELEIAVASESVNPWVHEYYTSNF